MKYYSFQEIVGDEALRVGGAARDDENFGGWVMVIPSDNDATVFMPVVHWYEDHVIITLGGELVKNVPIRLAYSALTTPDLDDIFLATVHATPALLFVEADDAMELGDFLELPTGAESKH